PAPPVSTWIWPPLPPLLRIEELAWIARPLARNAPLLEMTVIWPAWPLPRGMLAWIPHGGNTRLLFPGFVYGSVGLPSTEMVPLARTSIQDVPWVPPEMPTSEPTSPLCVPVASIVIVVPDQTSTQAVELAGLPGRR